MHGNGGTAPLKVKTNLRELAYRSFTQSLVASRIRPGQFMSQRELVAMTGIPLSAIRELIPRLEAERLIETVPQRGLRVAGVDLRMVKEVFQLWAVLAKAGAEAFIEIAPDDLIEELALAHRAILLRAGEMPDEELADNSRRLEQRLHDLLIGALGNEIIADLYRVNQIKIEMIRLARGGWTRHSILSSLEERVEILDALKLRDALRLAKAVAAHIEAMLHRAMKPMPASFSKERSGGTSKSGKVAA
ncbi:MAG TPA: GntR family transcriptional regulator [Hyphomicrobiales bacterium]|jgi:DNA-binding GntR family transcriptional regulator